MLRLGLLPDTLNSDSVEIVTNYFVICLAPISKETLIYAQNRTFKMRVNVQTISTKIEREGKNEVVHNAKRKLK